MHCLVSRPCISIDRYCAGAGMLGSSSGRDDQPHEQVLKEIGELCAAKLGNSG